MTTAVEPVAAPTADAVVVECTASPDGSRSGLGAANSQFDLEKVPMFQLVLLGLLLLVLLGGIQTLLRGSVKISGSTELKGGTARGVGFRLVAVAVVIAAFAMFVLPNLR